MTTYFQLRSRYRQIYLLFALIAGTVFAFWVYELRQSLTALDKREEETIKRHQELQLERKAEQLDDFFREIYQSTRTIALLPMVRGVRGENRLHESEDVVLQGRFSLDAHRTLQQIYTNLQNNVQLSEVYYVLDGFDPVRNVPFFMYDNLIAGTGLDAVLASLTAGNDAPPEQEEDEYRHFPVQLDWFRKNAPEFVWAKALDNIPVRLSPVLRTCDNSQYLSLKNGNESDAHGIIYAMPVYALEGGKFKGMITAVIRINVLESMLIGVPFIPVTKEDEERQGKAGWTMPKPSPFQLKQAEFDIVVRDRRNAVIAATEAQGGGRWATLSVDLNTGSPWELSHFIDRNEIASLTAPIAQERQGVIVGRVILLLILAAGAIWNLLVMNRTRRELMEMAHFDPLTALPNRRLFLDQLDHGLARAKRNNKKLALLFLDVANFNAINDAHGNQGGDQLLVALAERLQKTVRASDTVGMLTEFNGDRHAVARLGGDQFTIICEEIEDAESLTGMMERLIGVVGIPFKVGARSLEIAVNIGVAVYPDDADDGDKLLICADGAMHECRKEALPYFFYNEKLRTRSERIHQLSLELKRALELGQYELFYQPKASLKDGRITSLEGLLRWRHPEFGLVSPMEFIPILERNGDILDVGKWVIEQACRDLARLQGEGFDSIQVSVNVSVRQLRRGNLHETVAEILQRTGTLPQRLVLEVTESMMMENLEEGCHVLHQLDQLGTRLAIDDFGTGYSSLTYLQHLPISYLKLDKAFIDSMDLPRARHIVQSVIQLADGLSLTTIAEGIETVEQRDLLAGMGCDIMQGYLLSKPQPYSAIVAWLREYQWSSRPFGAEG